MTIKELKTKSNLFGKRVSVTTTDNCRLDGLLSDFIWGDDKSNDAPDYGKDSIILDALETGIPGEILLEDIETIEPLQN